MIRKQIGLIMRRQLIVLSLTIVMALCLLPLLDGGVVVLGGLWAFICVSLFGRFLAYFAAGDARAWLGLFYGAEVVKLIICALGLGIGMIYLPSKAWLLLVGFGGVYLVGSFVPALKSVEEQ